MKVQEEEGAREGGGGHWREPRCLLNRDPR